MNASTRAAVALLLSIPAIAQAQGLYYSGYLETTDGVPVEGSTGVTLRLWTSETGEALADLACQLTVAAEVVEGFFRVPFDSTCEAALAGNSDLWLEVEADFGDDSEVFDRTPVGAVPYARRAEQAEDFAVAGQLTVGWQRVFNNISGNSSIVLANATCPSGWRVVGGGCSGGTQRLLGTAPSSNGERWECIVDNPAATTVFASAYAICVPLVPSP